jgi:hypothetical protein
MANWKETSYWSIPLWIYLLYNIISTSCVDCKKKCCIVTGTRKVWKEASSLGYFNVLSQNFPGGPEGYHRNLSEDCRDWNFMAIIWSSHDFRVLYLFCWKLHLYWTPFKHRVWNLINCSMGIGVGYKCANLEWMQ